VSAAALAGGIVLAAGAAFCFDGAVALQALEARSVTADSGAGLLRRLVARPRWLAATALAIAGWPLQVAALALAPLTVVQPTLAVGLILLLALGVRLLGEPAGMRDVGAAAAIAAGLALLAWGAPDETDVHAGAGALVAVLGPLAAIAAVPWVLRARAGGRLLVLAAGCGYAVSGVTSKLLTDSLAASQLLAALAWAAGTAVVAGVALGDEMSALRRVGAARVAAGAFALQTIVPVLAAPVLTGEHWTGTPLGGGAVLAGLVLVVAGSLLLGAGTPVRRLVTAAPAGS
jgi:drug/metabolite transporter (DMT)-like permease